MHLEPLTVGDELLVHVTYPVQRPRLLALAIRTLASRSVIDLDLEALNWEPGLLVGRVEVNPRVARRFRQRLHFELEVLEVPPGIKEVRARPVRHDLAVANFPGVLMLAGLPTVQIFPVEQRDPPLVRRQ